MFGYDAESPTDATPPWLKAPQMPMGPRPSLTDRVRSLCHEIDLLRALSQPERVAAQMHARATLVSELGQAKTEAVIQAMDDVPLCVVTASAPLDVGLVARHIGVEA